MTEPARRITIISGLSGAGRTVVLRTLEDLGHHCIDNIPLDLILAAGLSLKRDGVDRIALGIDIREKGSLDRFDEACKKLREAGFGVEVLFLDASDDVLIRRFKETRRPHPLMGAGDTLRDAIKRERENISLVLRQADRVIDTSPFSPHQLRDRILSLYAGAAGGDTRFLVHLLSFGFKYGPPSEADIVMDARFLPNPFFIPDLKDLTGLHPSVRDYVMASEAARDFLDRFLGFLGFLLPRYREEGKSMLTIALGCTGGQHRSPALVEALGKRLGEVTDAETVVRHREIGGG